MNKILKVKYHGDTLKAEVEGRVLRVFDTNGFGDLVPILFTTIRGGFQLENDPAGQVYVEVGNTDDEFAVVNDSFKSTDITNIYTNADIDRILKVFGFEAKHCTAFSLGCVGPSNDLIFTISKLVTNGEMRALAEELEANPPTLKE